MTDADIEDIAEEAVNELLNIYGYEGLDKTELKASLKKRRLPVDSNQTNSKSYFQTANMDRLLTTTTSSRMTKPSRFKIQPNTTSAFTTFTTRNTNGTVAKNVSLCEWCKKEKAQIIETIHSTLSDMSGTKLKFCSPACLNSYKLDVVRQETEACLRSNMSISKELETTSSKRKSSSECSSTSRSNSHKTNTEHVEKRRHDLWTSAGIGKKSAGKILNQNRKLNSVSLKNLNNAKTKKRSSAPRPHPYYALNKKYWLNVKGGNEETKSEENSEFKNEDISNAISVINQETPPTIVKTDPPIVNSNVSLANLLSALPLNLVWIPIPIPIPLPIPVPIPLSSGREMYDFETD